MTSAPSASLAFGILLAAGCSTAERDYACVFEEAYQVQSTAATMLAGARLERVKSGLDDTLIVLGTDDAGGTVRWAVLPRDASKSGPVPPTLEASAPVPAHAAGPWFGLAASGDRVPDTVVIAWGEAASPGAPFTIRAYAAPLSGGLSAVPANTEVLARDLDAQTQVAMGSARSGKAAALAWGPAGIGLKVAVIGPDAKMVPDHPVLLPAPSPPDVFSSLSCIGFLPGIEDITLGYADLVSATESRWFSAELRTDDGVHWAVPLSFDYRLSTGMVACPVAAGQPAGDGYVFGWQDPAAGTWLGVGSEIEAADAGTISTVGTSRVLSASLWSGPAPVVGAVAAMPRARYAVVLETPQGPQVVPVSDRDSAGRSRPLPSAQGRTGAVGFQPTETGLWVTYADYTGHGTSEGSRYLVKVACP